MICCRQSCGALVNISILCLAGDQREVEEQGLGHPPLLLGNRGVALEPLAVDDRQVEAGPGAEVEEDRIDDFAGADGQAEGDVGNSEHGRAGGRASLISRRPSMVSTAPPM